jgi:hypothetical protein
VLTKFGRTLHVKLLKNKFGSSPGVNVVKVIGPFPKLFIANAAKLFQINSEHIFCFCFKCSHIIFHIIWQSTNVVSGYRIVLVKIPAHNRLSSTPYQQRKAQQMANGLPLTAKILFNRLHKSKQHAH